MPSVRLSPSTRERLLEWSSYQEEAAIVAAPHVMADVDARAWSATQDGTPRDGHAGFLLAMAPFVCSIHSAIDA
jgi:hypothetical protein